jgi:chromosome segregation ATPase
MALITCRGDTSRRLKKDDKSKEVIMNNPEDKKFALKFEVKKLKNQVSDSSVMKEKVDFLILKCEEITDERDALLVLSQRTREEREALESEARRLRLQWKKNAQLEEEVKAVCAQRDRIAKERDSLKYRVKRSEASCESLKKAMENQKAETEELRAQFKHFALQQEALNIMRQEREYVTRERNTYMVKAQRKAGRSDALKFERDALKVQIEGLRTKIKDTDVLEKQIRSAELNCESVDRERGDLKTKVRWMAGDREAMRLKIDSLKTERDALLAQYNKIGQLERELSNEKQQCENVSKEIRNLMMSSQATAEERETIRKEKKSLKLERKKLLGRCKNCASLEKELSARSQYCESVQREISSLMSAAYRKAADREALTKERDGVKLAAGLRDQSGSDTERVRVRFSGNVAKQRVSSGVEPGTRRWI